MARVEELERLLGRNSRNSSVPPSRDSRKEREKRRKKRSGRKRGGQPGDPGSTREMVADPDRVGVHWPERGGGCGRSVGVADRDGDPVCHHVSEVVVCVEVTEHQRMPVRCRCGCRTLAELQPGAPAGAVGLAVQAAAATLTAARVSRREVARLLKDSLGVTLCPASVEALVKQTSQTLEQPYVGILEQVDQSPVRGAELDRVLSDPESLMAILELWRREVVETGRSVLSDGRPTIAMETFIRLMVLKQRYRWG